MEKLEKLKQKMIDTKITYASYEQSLWDFAGLQITIENQVNNMTASFSENEKRKKLNKLLESIADIEGDLIQAV